MDKIKAIIRARMGSSRLPGKVLKKICGKSLLEWQVDRLKRSKMISEIIIATSRSKIDNQIVNLCKKEKIKYFRGSEKDVLDRVSKTIEKFNVDIVAEFTGDSPLPDIGIVDKYIREFLRKKNKYDFLSNAIKTTYPPGMDVVIYKGTALIELNANLKISDPLREHCSYNIIRFPKKYRLLSKSAPVKYRFPNIHVEVDTKEDFKFINEIIKYFHLKKSEYFDLESMLKFIENNQELLRINSNVFRKWKQFREK